MFILNHNLWTRNVGKSIKGSKDSHLSLVSNEKFSEILWPSGWALGQATGAKIAPKPLHYEKSATPNQKIFF